MHFVIDICMHNIYIYRQNAAIYMYCVDKQRAKHSAYNKFLSVREESTNALPLSFSLYIVRRISKGN